MLDSEVYVIRSGEYEYILPIENTIITKNHSSGLIHAQCGSRLVGVDSLRVSPILSAICSLLPKNEKS